MSGRNLTNSRHVREIPWPSGRWRAERPSFWGFTLQCCSLLSTLCLTVVVQQSEIDCISDRP